MDMAGFDVQKFMETVLAAVQGGNWKAGAALALVFCVYLSRKMAAKLPPKLGAWMLTDCGGSAYVLAMGMAGAVATGLLAGKPFNMALLLSGLTTGAMASGLRNVAWDIMFPSDKAKPAPEAAPGTVLEGGKPEETKPEEEKKKS